MKFRLTLLLVLLLTPLGPAQSLAAESKAAPQTPPELWKDYNPDKGDFKEEIVHEQTRDGVYTRDSYISAYVLGEEVRVFCKYAFRAGAKHAPGLLDVHGWMGAPNIDQRYVKDGWAVMSFDYCGRKDGRTQFTRYPASLDYGRMESKTIHARLPDGKDITDPKQTSHYLWFAIQRRVLSHLLAQQEVDKTRIGAKGYSYGGTLMWNLGLDPRETRQGGRHRMKSTSPTLTATSGCAGDRHAKKELKKQVRGVREIERAVEAEDGEQGEVVRAHCGAVRSALGRRGAPAAGCPGAEAARAAASDPAKPGRP